MRHTIRRVLRRTCSPAVPLVLTLACMGANSPTRDAEGLEAGRTVSRDGDISSPKTPSTWIREGSQAEAGFGTVLGGGGDINGDGLGDLLIAEPGFVSGSNAPTGRVLVFFGTSHGFRSEPDRVLSGSESGARFGFHAAILGDINRDGFEDVGIGSPSFSGGIALQGRVDVFLGSADGLAPEPAWTHFGGELEMQLGRIHRAGDVNGDGFDDVLTVASDGGAVPSGIGEVLLFLGSREGLMREAVWRRNGSQKSEFFGDMGVALGDLNGDGYGDFLFGMMLHDDRVEDEGRVELYFGCEQGLESAPRWSMGLPVAEGPWVKGPIGPRFGSALASAGDWNGDGVPDWVVGASHMSHEDEMEGHAYAWYGRRSGAEESPDWRAEGNEVAGHFGTGMAGVGDVNGDGREDLVITGRTLDHGEVNEGVVALYLGTKDGLPAWPDWTAESNQRGAELGGVVVALGDVNGDGLNDFAAGSRYYSREGVQLGEVRVYWGRRGAWSDGSGWTPELAWRHRWRRALDRAVASAGWWLALGIAVLLAASGVVFARLVLARRRARREIETIRSRLHDFVGSELAGVEPPDRRLRGVMEELRATIWTLKQEAPTVAGLIGYLSDWAWRFAREQDVTLRLDLPRGAVGHRTIDFEIAEAMQGVMRQALSQAVEQAGARTIHVGVRLERRCLTVEIRDDGEGRRAGEWGTIARTVERWGGRLDFLAGMGPGASLTVTCPFRVRAWFGKRR